MRLLLAIAYFMFLGWAIRYWELDQLALEAGHKALRELMREHAQITLEVHGTGPLVMVRVPAVLPDAPAPVYLFDKAE